MREFAMLKPHVTLKMFESINLNAKFYDAAKANGVIVNDRFDDEHFFRRAFEVYVHRLLFVTIPPKDRNPNHLPFCRN